MKPNQDELLKPLFNKIQMEKAPDDITSRVMEEILMNPEIASPMKFYYDWWWFGIGLLSLFSLYFTGVFSFLNKLFTPYLFEVFSMVSRYTGGLAQFLPSNIIILPNSYVLPVILPGILFILLIDTLFGWKIKESAGQ